jgi:AraC-like DNA-binding protein
VLLEYGNTIALLSWHLNEPRDTRYLRIYYVYEADIAYQDSFDRVDFQPNMLYILPSALPYRAWRLSDRDFRCTFLHMTIFPVSTSRLMRFPVKPDSMEEHLLIALSKAIDLDNTAMIEALSLALQPLFMDNEACRRPSPSMSHLLAYIFDHLGEDLSIDRLSRMMHFNPRYFIKLFKQETGCSPHNYINSLRMYQAERLIRDGTPVNRVAEMVGFSNSSSFSRAFRTYWGTQPRKRSFKKHMP